MDVSEQELFDAATSANPMQELAVEPAEPEQTAETARDDKGRFAPKVASETQPEQVEEQPVEQATPEQPARQGFVPSSRLKEEADARRAERERADRLEQMLAQMLQQQAKPATPAAEPEPQPQVWDDPVLWGQGLIKPVQQQLEDSLFETRKYYSHREAVRDFGAEKVKEATATFDKLLREDAQNGPGALAAIKKSVDPIREIVSWYDGYQERQDPALARQRQIERLLEDPDMRELVTQKLGVAAPQPAAAAAPARSGPSISLPSLSKVGATSLPSRGGTEDDAALWEAATKPKR